MAYAEAAVVVYLRLIYYPEGFSFPLKPIPDTIVLTEIMRESATILMLFSIAALSSKKTWERFSYFLFCFGIWDIFYYIWLKILLDWPSSLFDWDILFLIPLPWVGPVIAPVTVSLLMIAFGLIIINMFHHGYEFRPSMFSRILAAAGTGMILLSFMRDTDAALYQKLPQPYSYELLFMGELAYLAAFMISYLNIIKKIKSNRGKSGL